ncbi:MAG: hypothetical protein WC829_15035 [Hyphomicrobium sp.]|jgi:hypothetical protein
MTANKNEPGNKAAGSTPAQASTRPHATLDLKATEVTPPAGDKPEAAASDKSKASATSTAGPAAPGATATSGASAAAASSAAPKSSSATPEAPKVGKPGAAIPPGKTGGPAGASPPASGPKQQPRGSGGFFTHLAAGLVGGIIALFAADMVADQLGFKTTDVPDKTAALEQRLAAVEASQNQRAARFAVADTKIGKIDQLDANLDGVSEKQAQLAKELAALSDKLQTQGDDSQTTARVAKLEEQLTLMASAADGDPQSGRLPQLAALSGKLADLESTLANQLDALRKNVAQEIDARLSAATETSQAARSGTQRIDRELSTLKAETAETVAGISALKTDSDRTAAALRTSQEDLKRLKADIDGRLAAFAKAEDVSSAVAPLDNRLASLQQDVQGVIKSEGDRRSTAERIVLSLELANLKRAIDRGKPYAPELTQARSVAGNFVDLAPLDRFALEGVSTTTELRQEFKPVAFKIIDAEEQPENASIVDRLLAGAKSVVRVRKTSHSADDKSVEATVARMETALDEDRLADVLAQAKSLPQPAQDAAQEFVAKVQAREAVDRALAAVETQLKASLAAAPAEPSTNAQ